MLRSASECAAGFKKETEVENFFSGETSSLFALGAVVFHAESFDVDEVRRDAPVTYKIRLRAEQYKATYTPLASSSLGGSAGKWLTSHMFPRRTTIGPRGDMYGGEEPGWNQH